LAIDLSSQYVVNMSPAINKKFSRGGVIVWAIFAGLFVYAGIKKYGLLLAYLNVSGYLWLFLAGLITFKIDEKLDEKIRGRSQDNYATWQRLRFMKTVLVVSVFIGLIYLVIFVQPDKLVIAHFKGIPIEALYPCSNRPLDPEVEVIAREIFRLREIDRFDDDFCSSTE
jgi:hypothetical protein